MNAAQKKTKAPSAASSEFAKSLALLTLALMVCAGLLIYSHARPVVTPPRGLGGVEAARPKTTAAVPLLPAPVSSRLKEDARAARQLPPPRSETLAGPVAVESKNGASHQPRNDADDKSDAAGSLGFKVGEDYWEDEGGGEAVAQGSVLVNDDAVWN